MNLYKLLPTLLFFPNSISSSKKTLFLGVIYSFLQGLYLKT